MVISQNDISAIEAQLGASTTPSEATWVWTLRSEQRGYGLVLSVSNATDNEGATACVVSVQTHQGYVELHNVTAFLCIEPDEVMFIAKHADRFDSLVVGASGTCSQFGNVRASLLTADFTTLDPTYLMAAMQLSLAESLLETLP